MEHSVTTLDHPQPNGSFDPRPPAPMVQRPARSVATAVPRKSFLRWLRSEGTVIFLACLVIYFVVAWLLDIKYKTFPGDAFSRMANGFYILYSRDPHIAAVGFVWEPLTSFADMVFLLGNHLWPALSHNDMAGSLTSAVSMAGAVYQLNAALREWGIARLPRFVLTATFALNPMILYYSGNGMSEGLYLFTLIAGVRYLLRWIHTGDLRSLAYAGTALGFSYLTRNEAAAAVAAGAAVVALVSYWRTQGERSPRIRTAIADATIFAIPGVIAAAGWAICTYVITGVFFAQYSSLYGSSKQETLLKHQTFTARVHYEIHAVWTLWPAIPVVLLVAAVVALRRRDPRILAPLSILGGALGFDVLALLNNNIQPFYRYFIAALPIGILLVGSLVAPNTTTHSGVNADASPTRRVRRRGTRAVLYGGSLLLILLTAIPATIATGAAMFNPNLAPEEDQGLAFIFDSHLNLHDSGFEQRYGDILRIGSYMASLKLPNGDVLIDNSTDCVPEVIASISQPKLFVIPNDRDFQRQLSDPLTFHSHYILEPNPVKNPITAENLQYPALWKTGARFTKLVHQFSARGTCPEFRLFRVTEHPTQVH
jgi:hypothetical protein